MKPTIALLALFSVACGGGDGSPVSNSPTAPTAAAAPTAPATPAFPTGQVNGGQLFTYQNAVAFLPAGVAEYKVALVFLPGLRDPATGNDLDSRALVAGSPGGGCSIWCSQVERAEVRSRALKLAGGNVALIGTTTLVDSPSSYDTLLRTLSEFGTLSQHPEFAKIPIFFVGHSMGGCTAYGFSRVHGARVAGFLTMKGGCHSPAPAAAAAGVPGYFLIGALDEQYRRENITAVYEAGRAAGAPWTLSIDPFQHGPIVDFDVMFGWIDSVLASRLPKTSGAAFHPIRFNFSGSSTTPLGDLERWRSIGNAWRKGRLS
jgi:pimeloyl-ACP methyl ester carboxylesterase